MTAAPARAPSQPPDGTCYVGGLTRALRAGRPCVPHAANLTMVTVFSLHMMGAIANAGPHLEFSIEPEEHYPWQSPLFDPPLEVRDGKVQNPEAPGWGVAIRPDWLAGTEHRISALD